MGEATVPRISHLGNNISFIQRRIGILFNTPKVLFLYIFFNFFQKRIKFWFGTGGAGFCLSRPLASRLASLAAEDKFVRTADKMRLPDDVTMGYIVEMLAEVPLTRIDQFHSHLEPLRSVSMRFLFSLLIKV